MQKYFPHFLLFLTVLFWGSSFPLMTFLLETMSPMELALSRFFFPALLSLFYICLLKVWIDKIDVFRFLMAGMTGIFGFALFINIGQQSMTAGAGSFIVNCNPLFTSLIGFFILKQRVKQYFWLGIIICIIGILIISLENQDKISFNIGSLYLLIAAILVSCYFHITKPLVIKYGALKTFCFTLFLGTIPMLLWTTDTYQLIRNATNEIMLAIVWLSIVSTLVPYYTWTYSVGHFGANKASFFLFMIPIISIIVDKIIFNINPSYLTLIGGFIILLTVLIIMIFNHKENK